VTDKDILDFLLMKYNLNKKNLVLMIH